MLDWPRTSRDVISASRSHVYGGDSTFSNRHHDFDYRRNLRILDQKILHKVHFVTSEASCALIIHWVLTIFTSMTSWQFAWSFRGCPRSMDFALLTVTMGFAYVTTVTMGSKGLCFIDCNSSKNYCNLNSRSVLCLLFKNSM